MKYICDLKREVWDYLEVRTGDKLLSHITKSMVQHARKHSLPQKISSKWNFSEEEITNNIDGLATYVAEGIIEVIDGY